MKTFAYAIYDVAAGAYMRPWFARSDNEAIREFTHLATAADASRISDYPHDFTLFRIGLWDDNKGILEQAGPDKVQTALEAIAASRTIRQDNDLFDDELAPKNAGGTD